MRQPKTDTYPIAPGENGLLCWKAPLRPGEAPREGCHCRICKWLRSNAPASQPEEPEKES